MTPRRRQRLALMLLVVGGVAVSATLALRAFQENLLFFFSPTQVAAGEAPSERPFRLGGMVREDSLETVDGSLTVTFDVTDYANSVRVTYTGVRPDLFGERQGVVARGTLGADGSFMAEELLAKHDENYMPPEVAEALALGRERSGE